MALLLSLCIGLLVPVRPVEAHANLVRSTPAAGDVLAQAPSTAEFEFSEAIDPVSAKIRLLDSQSQVVANETPKFDPASPRLLRVSLPPLPDGIYTLAWQVRSAVDAHTTSGSVAFSVGIHTPRASLLPPPGAPDPARDLPDFWEALIRAVGYLSLALAAGSSFFAVVVWGPAFRRLPSPPQNWDHQLTGLLRRFLLIGALGAGVSLVGELVWQAISDPSGGSFWLRLIQNIDHHGSGILWVRVFLIPMLALTARSLPPAGRGPVRPWGEAASFAALLLLTYSLSGHNAASGQALPVIVDWLHLLAMGLWAGGLLPLACLLIWQARAADPALDELLPAVTRRFSNAALASVAALTVTGLYMTWLQVRTSEALTQTRYGQALILKVGLFGLLLALGAANLLRIMPLIARSALRGLHFLRRTVRVEVALVGLVLLVVGGLVNLSPGYDALQAEKRMGWHEVYRDGAVDLGLWVAPQTVGFNEFGVDVLDRRPGAGQTQPAVLLRFKSLLKDLGVTQAEAKPVAASTVSGAQPAEEETMAHEMDMPMDTPTPTRAPDAHRSQRYAVQGNYFPIAGTWQVEVILRKPGFNDVRHTFTVNAGYPKVEKDVPDNPVPMTAGSLEEGQALYQAYCLPCHGQTGQGDGPAGLLLNPRPSDLTKHAVPGVHSDGQLFEWISIGYPNSAMPAFEGQLSEQQRWDLVNFIRTLAR